MKLKNKVAIITGGSRGIGKEIAFEFLSEGAKVIICATNSKNLKSTVDELKTKFTDIDYYQVDVSNRTEVEKMFENVIDKFGTVDILVNNAGVSENVQLYKMTEEQWDSVIAVNLKGVFNCCSAAVKIMREQQYGKIITMSSTSALYGNFGQTGYSAAKAGVVGMTKSMAKELGKNNINVNVIVPGVILTEMIEKVPDKILQIWKERTPLNRFGLPSDVAKACVFLASEDAGFITGTVLCVNGGITV